MASADIGTAYIRIAPNMSGIQGKIMSGFKGAGASATKQLSDEVDSGSGPFQGAIGKLGGIAKVGGAAIATGIAAGAAGIAALTGKMLASGAELEQQLGGSEAVFGQYASGVQKVAADAYKNMGLSQNEFLAGANKMGSLYQGAGVSVEKSMQMSADAIQRASDVASIMGIDTTTALESVAGMAKGNFTMMDNLGVAMNDTALNAYALEKGIGKTTQQMSAQEKVSLATQMFMEKTAKYAGNYAKENETLAGSMNTTKKAFDDFLSGGGSIDNFINSLISTIGIAAPKIIELLPTIVGGLEKLITAVVPVIGQILPKLVPAIISAAVALVQAIVDQMPVIIQTLLAALPQLINGFIQLFGAIVQALPQIIEQITAAIPSIIDSIVTALTNPTTLTQIILGAIQLFMALLQAIPVIITALIDAVPRIYNALVTTLTSPQFIDGLMRSGVKLIVSLVAGVISMIGSVGQAAGSIIGTIANTLSPSNLIRIGGDLVRGLWNGINDMTGWIIGKIRSFGDSIMNGIKSFFGIHSPSTEWAWIGKMDALGLAKGFTDNTGVVVSAAKKMGSEAMAAMTGVNNSLASGFNSTITTSQSINAGDYETPAKVVINVDANINDQMDLNKIASDLGYAVAMA